MELKVSGVGATSFSNKQYMGYTPYKKGTLEKDEMSRNFLEIFNSCMQDNFRYDVHSKKQRNENTIN